MGILRFLTRPIVLILVALILLTVFLVYTTDNNQNSTGPVGARNKAMLSGPYYAVQFEIDYMPGMRPPQEALDRFAGFVTEHTGKLAIMRLTEIQSYAQPSQGNPLLPCLSPPCGGGYSIENVIQIHARERNVYPLPGMVSVWILYADQPSDEGEQIGGAAFCATCIVVFEPGARTDYVVQGIILAHEYGHLLGLCAINYTDVRGHCDGEGHSSNPDSLMYYAPDLDDPNVRALRLTADELADLEDLRNDRL